ncbi:COMPASS complex protein [Auriculariales sp. MPI-PUGE-AT-0066]|nr:COMPASS complex protein [Auriculariales sp. MPI-PUGE-AT-0066]
MNASFLNPFSVTYPTAIQATLERGYAVCARFNPTGRLVATGTYNGSAIVWDLDTAAIVRQLDGHARKKQVTSVAWSRNSRFLLSAGKDWNIVIWDLSATAQPLDRHATIRFDQPVSYASFHPRNCQIVLAVLASGEAFLVDRRPSTKSRIELCEPAIDESQRSAIVAASFDPSGKHVFAGTAGGSILVFNTRMTQMVGRYTVPGAPGIKHLAFTQSGKYLLTNSTDRALRRFEVPHHARPKDGTWNQAVLEPLQRFSDPISRPQWNAAVFSPDGEWLAGGAADAVSHKIFIWDLASGQFTTSLDGGRELLTDMDWHPNLPILVSVNKMGDIHVWNKPTEERWGAFAGGFEEVDENVEYGEREDEFDIEEEEVIKERKRKAEEEPVDLADDSVVRRSGVTTQLDEDTAWADEEPDDDTDPDWQLPVIYEVDSELE